MRGTVLSESVSVSRRCSTWIGNSSQPAKATTKNNIDRWITGVGAAGIGAPPRRRRRSNGYDERRKGRCVEYASRTRRHV